MELTPEEAKAQLYIPNVNEAIDARLSDREQETLDISAGQHAPSEHRQQRFTPKKASAAEPEEVMVQKALAQRTENLTLRWDEEPRDHTTLRWEGYNQDFLEDANAGKDPDARLHELPFPGRVMKNPEPSTQETLEQRMKAYMDEGADLHKNGAEGDHGEDAEDARKPEEDVGPDEIADGGFLLQETPDPVFLKRRANDAFDLVQDSDDESES